MSVINAPDFGAQLLSPEGRRDPYPIYSLLRQGPVYWSDALHAWLVAKYKDVSEVYHSHDRFSSVGAYTADLSRLPAETRAQLPLIELTESTQALEGADPPVHGRQRLHVMAQLAPRRLESRREEFKGQCEALADRLAAEPQPDVLRDFSTPLAYMTLDGLFGAPPEIVPLYAELSDAFMAIHAYPDWDIGAALRYERVLERFRDVLELGYHHLRDDDNGSVIASLLHPPPDRTRLEADEMFAILKTFFAAAIDNIILMIPHVIMTLLAHPDQFALVRDDPQLVAAAFEESFRWNVTTHVNMRIAACDTELGGSSMKAGDRAVILVASANRDPEVWTDPDRFAYVVLSNMLPPDPCRSNRYGYVRRLSRPLYQHRDGANSRRNTTHTLSLRWAFLEMV
jgi:cytochrome P450